MTIKELIQKALKGETLTDDERNQLGAYDPDQANKAAIDSAAAGARRKAEEELAKIRKELEAANEKATGLETENAQLKKSLGDNQKLGNAEVENLKKQMELFKKERDEEKAARAALEKNQRIDALIAKAGFKYAEGFDSAIINGALHAQLAELDDNGLKDIETASTPFESARHGSLFKTHREKWKGALLDESGRGSGNPQTGSAGDRYDGVNPWKKDTRNSTRQLEIEAKDPALAAQLKKEAGVQPPAF